MEKLKNLDVQSMDMTQGEERWWEGRCRLEGHKWEIKWDKCNNIINKLYLKIKVVLILDEYCKNFFSSAKATVRQLCCFVLSYYLVLSFLLFAFISFCLQPFFFFLTHEIILILDLLFYLHHGTPFWSYLTYDQEKQTEMIERIQCLASDYLVKSPLLNFSYESEKVNVSVSKPYHFPPKMRMQKRMIPNVTPCAKSFDSIN